MGDAKRSLRPAWLRTRLPGGEGYARVRRLLREKRLSTVCEEARCPNKGACWGSGTATFLVLGARCTRRCAFCSVKPAEGPLPPPDPGEAERIVEAARILGLRHVVVTSVTRDDLEDGGAGHIAAVVSRIHEDLPAASVEALVPELREAGIRAVIAAGVDVLAHNVEVVRRLTPIVRDARADFDGSLEVLRSAKRIAPDVRTKSSLLVGLGETQGEILETLDDMREAGVDIVAIGQYLRPTRRNVEVAEYVTPERWDGIRAEALARGFAHVAAGPFVRTSYRAHEAVHRVRLVPYAEGLTLQSRAQDDLRARGVESLIVLAHPAVITLGRKADASLVTAERGVLEQRGIEVVRTTRGGEVTYHGPGQLVVYPIVDIAKRGMRGRGYVALLLDAALEVLAGYGIEAFLVPGVIGVFVGKHGASAKIAAVGVSVSRGVTGHGMALNVSTDLEAYSLIVPCGLRDHGVTSMREIVDPAPAIDEVASRLVSALRSRLGEHLRILPL